MSTHYETMFILKPTLTEEEHTARIDAFKAIIEKQGGQIAGVEVWGTRQLAYPIEKNERGFYAIIYFTAEAEAITELERVYRITEDVIRFNVVKYTRKVELKAWERMVKKANGEQVEEIKLSDTPRQRPDAGRRGGRRFERGDRPERGERGERGDRGDRPERGERRDRDSDSRPPRENREPVKAAEASSDDAE